MTKDHFLSIATKSEGIYKEKGSKFLGFAIPVNSENTIRETLQQYRKEYYDSRHVCYAYMLGAEKKIFNASDGGEPAHTAGDPILNEIRSSGLSNILVIVVRYFGGTKLGKPGLIAAYKESAADALRNAKVIEVVETENLPIVFEYSETNEVNSLVNELGAQISSQRFEAKCFMELAVPKSKIKEAERKLERYRKK